MGWEWEGESIEDVHGGRPAGADHVEVPQKTTTGLSHPWGEISKDLHCPQSCLPLSPACRPGRELPAVPAAMPLLGHHGLTLCHHKPSETLPSMSCFGHGVLSQR